MSRLEAIVLAQAAFLAVCSTWALGGNSDGAQTLLSVVGSAAAPITVLALGKARPGGPRGLGRSVFLLWLAFNAVVLLSTLRPSFMPRFVEGSTVFVEQATSWLAPSSARPALTLRALWLFDALFLPAFNLVLVVTRRRSLRLLFWILLANGTGLAVFGTLQKLLRAPGLFFGAVPSPNARFFASFIYHNHWGAAALLLLSVGFALVFHSLRHRSEYRGFFHSPAFAALTCAGLIALTLPLSSSRSSTVLGAALTLIALVHGARLRGAEPERSPTRPPGRLLLLFAAAALVATGVFLARPQIEERLEDTRRQVAHMRSTDSLGSRAELYRDTARMAAAQPLWGWGLGTYPVVFPLYNRQVAPDRLPVFFADAHSDWLQSLAETGWVGTLLRGTLLVLPALALLRARPLGALAAYPAAGCGLILLYAAVEFPFGNAAVTYLFFLIGFAAVRSAQLSRPEDRP